MNSFWQWWQHLPENIDPVIFQIGGFKLQYYGLMYFVFGNIILATAVSGFRKFVGLTQAPLVGILRQF